MQSYAPPSGTPVDVYFNLHKRVFSVRARSGPLRGKVIAHTDRLTLHTASFHVSEAGHARVLATGHKNVHAVVRGTLTEHEASPTSTWSSVRYDPFRYAHFYDTTSPDRAITVADFVLLELVGGHPRVSANMTEPPVVQSSK